MLITYNQKDIKHLIRIVLINHLHQIQNMSKFKAKDEVRLKSGSHTMTVVGNAIVPTAEGNVPILDKYECSWFDGTKSQKAIFKEADIELIGKRK